MPLCNVFYWSLFEEERALFSSKNEIDNFDRCSEGYLCSAREEGTSLHSSDSLLWSLSCKFLADSTLVPCWCQDGPSATYAIDLSAQDQAERYFKSNLLPILQTPVQRGNCTPYPHYWKHMLDSVHRGWSQCSCRQGGLGVTDTKISDVTRPVSRPGDVGRVSHKEVTPCKRVCRTGSAPRRREDECATCVVEKKALCLTFSRMYC